MEKIYFILVCITLSFSVFAESSRQKDSHEHGAANLKMGMEGQKLQLEFDVPSESLIGFEHFPKSQSNRDNFLKAIETLSKPSELFSIPSKAECLLVGVNVSQSLFSGDGGYGHENKGEHGHEDKGFWSNLFGHDEDEHHDHGHDESEKSEIHSEFHSKYNWNCLNLDELDSVGTQLMAIYPKIEEIRVNWISSNGQGSLELESKEDRLKGWN